MVHVTAKQGSASVYGNVAAAASVAPGTLAHASQGQQCRPSGIHSRFCNHGKDVNYDIYNLSSSGESLTKYGDLLDEVFVLYEMPRLTTVAAGAAAPAGFPYKLDNVANVATLYQSGHIGKDQVEAIDQGGLTHGYSRKAEYVLLKNARFSIGSHQVTETSGQLEIFKQKCFKEMGEGQRDFMRFSDKRSTGDHLRILPLDLWGNQVHKTAIVLSAAAFTQFRISLSFNALESAVWKKSGDYDVYASAAQPTVFLGSVQSYLPPQFAEKLRTQEFHELITQTTVYSEKISIPAAGGSHRFDHLPLNTVQSLGAAVVLDATAFECSTLLPSGRSPIAKIQVRINALEHANTHGEVQQYLSSKMGYLKTPDSGMMIIPFAEHAENESAGGLSASNVDRLVVDLTLQGDGFAEDATVFLIYFGLNTLWYSNNVANLGYAS